VASESRAVSPSERLSGTDELPLKTSQFKRICPTQACTKPNLLKSDRPLMSRTPGCDNVPVSRENEGCSFPTPLLQNRLRYPGTGLVT
jgi:hypothetical protein